MKKWKLLPTVVAVLSISTAHIAVPAAVAEDTFIDFWQQSDRGSNRPKVNPKGTCRQNTGYINASEHTALGLTFNKSQKVVEENLGPDAPPGAKKKAISQLIIKGDPGNTKARFISRSGFDLKLSETEIGESSYPPEQPHQLKKGDALYEISNTSNDKLPDDPNTESTKIAKDVNPQIQGSSPTYTFSYVLNDNIEFVKALMSGDKAFGLESTSYAERNGNNFNYQIVTDFLPVPWETHSCQLISLDKSKMIQDHLVVDGRNYETGIKVATNQEDLADHATETRFVAAAYYNDGVTPVRNTKGEHAQATVNAEGEVVLSLPDGSFDPSITDSTGASVAGSQTVKVRVFALPRSKDGMRAKSDPKGDIEQKPTSNKIYGNELEKYLADPETYPKNGNGLQAYFRDYSYIGSADLNIDDQKNHDYNYVNPNQTDETVYAKPGKWVELKWTYKTNLPVRETEIDGATAAKVKDAFNAKYEIVETGGAANVPAGWEIEFSKDKNTNIPNYSKLRVYAPENATYSDVLAFRTKATFSNFSTQERSFLFKIAPSPRDLFKGSYKTKAVWEGTTETSDLKIQTDPVVEGVKNSTPSGYAIRDDKGQQVTKTNINGWEVSIDPKTGKLTATAPFGADPTKPLEVPVLALFGPNDEPAKIMGSFYPLQIKSVPVPNYTLVTGEPGGSVDNSPEIPALNQGDTIELSTPISQTDDKGNTWKLSVDPTTGKITAAIPKNAANGDKLIPRIEYTYTPKDGPSYTGTTYAYFAVVNDVNAPSFPPAVTQPGADPFRVVIEKGDNVDLSTIKVDNVPDDWNVQVEPNGVLLITPPADQPKSPLVPIDVSFTFKDGKPGKTTEWVTITENPTPVQQPITKAVKKEERNELTIPGSTINSIVDDSNVPNNWTVNVENGKLIVVPGSDAIPGARGEVVVKTTAPDGKEVDRRFILINVPKDGAVKNVPDTIVKVVDNGSTEKFDIGSKVNKVDGAPDNWNVTIDGDQITVTPDDTVKNGERVDLTVKTDDGDRTIVLVNRTPNSGGPVVTPAEPGKDNTVPLVINNIINVESNDLPDGWKIEEKDGKVIVIPPADAKPGTYDFNIVVTDKEGNKKNEKVIVVVENNEEKLVPNSKEGSSTDGIERCFYNFLDSPLLFLLPLSLLAAVGFPIVQIMGPEVQRVAGSIGAQFRNQSNDQPGDRPGDRGSSEPEWLTNTRFQLNTLAEPLNRALGIQTDIVPILGGALALVASAATIAYLCTAEKGSTMSSTGLGAKILNEEAPNNAKASSSKDGDETGSADNKDPFEGSSKAPSSEDKSNDK